MSDEIYQRSFARNIGILTAEEQERLSQSTVAIAGLGGIGGNTLVLLARMGVGRFRLADFDRFDHANINRQYGARADTIGKLKCEVLAEEVQQINPSALVEVFADGFTEENGDALLAGADLAVDAIDFYAIETHLRFHRETRRHGLYTLMGSPVGFSACLQVFAPDGMSLEEYCAIQPGMSALEKQLRYACGLVPELAHLEYFDVSAGAANTDFLSRTGPSLSCACALAASLVAAESVLLLLKRRPPRVIPNTFQFDPYTFRYEQSYLEGGMSHFDPDPRIERITDKSSLIPRVLKLFYKKKNAQKAVVNGAQLYYEVEGRGKDLLLVSPLGADASFWARQTQNLARHFRVISFDNRGSGSSSPCADACTTQSMAEDASALLEYLGVRHAHVVGLALGSLIAQQLAAQRPQLVDRLILVSAYAKADDHIVELTRVWRKLAVDKGMEALFDVCLPWVFSPEYVNERQGDLEKLRAFYRLTLQQAHCFCQQSLAGVAHDSSALLHRIQCPTLVVYGDSDRIVSRPLAESLAGGIPQSQLLRVEAAPHFLIWEHADRFNREVIQFLAGGEA